MVFLTTTLFISCIKKFFTTSRLKVLHYELTAFCYRVCCIVICVCNTSSTRLIWKFFAVTNKNIQTVNNTHNYSRKVTVCRCTKRKRQCSVDIAADTSWWFYWWAETSVCSRRKRIRPHRHCDAAPAAVPRRRAGGVCETTDV